MSVLNKIKKTVCIFAHPDDESFGPSGTIAKLAGGGEVYIICVTNGNDKTNGAVRDLAQKRRKELENAAGTLGVKKVFFLKYEDGELNNNLYHRVYDDIKKITDRIKPDTLITFEMRGISGHIDHVFCSMVASFLFHKTLYPKRILYAVVMEKESEKMYDYFIHFPKGYLRDDVDLIVDVSDFWETKIEAVKAHKSQIKDVRAIMKDLLESPKEEYFLIESKE